jgi:hypothetical protein
MSEMAEMLNGMNDGNGGMLPASIIVSISH